MKDILRTLGDLGIAISNAKFDGASEAVSVKDKYNELADEVDRFNKSEKTGDTIGFYKAVCKETKEEWVVYAIIFMGFPEPKFSSVKVMRNDRSGYDYKALKEVDIYKV